MKLDKVTKNAQMICEAIASVVSIDVTIVDEALMRIAGTGRYKGMLSERVNQNSAFSYSLNTGAELIIENPGEHHVCSLCDCKDKCNEYAEVCCPIKLGADTIGVIGLIAFDDVQKNRILDNQENLLEFLRRMSELISSKVNEQYAIEEAELLAKELEIVVDSIDTGFLAIKCDGTVIRANKKLLKMANVESLINVRELFDEMFKCDEILTQGTLSNYPFEFKNGAHGLLDVSLICIGEKNKGHVITFRMMEQVIDTVNEVILDVVTTTFDSIVGESEEILNAKKMASKVAATPSTVLILGESGTGKELFARAIHKSSKRRECPFIAVNCAAIPEQLLESELFGYDEGAFTGAKKGGKPGKFQLANRGTLFLDEIGDMPIHLQAKLLRALQDGEIERVGGKAPIKVDVRIIAATNQDIESKVEDGSFRPELYYRLNVIPINVPPLRQRLSDIRLLTTKMVNRASVKLNKEIIYIDELFFQTLMKYNWPGNVRELENTLEYAVNMCEDSILNKQCLPKRFLNLAERVEPDYSHIISDKKIEMSEDINGLSHIDDALRGSYEPIETLQEIEIKCIKRALEYYKPYKYSTAMAAEALGISRATLYRKIALYSIEE